MTLYERIMALYPSLTQKDFLSVITLQNNSDGDGDYIKEWKHSTFAKPSDSELNS